VRSFHSSLRGTFFVEITQQVEIDHLRKQPLELGECIEGHTLLASNTGQFDNSPHSTLIGKVKERIKIGQGEAGLGIGLDAVSGNSQADPERICLVRAHLMNIAADIYGGLPGEFATLKLAPFARLNWPHL